MSDKNIQKRIMSSSGFSLVELLVVITIIAILMGIGFTQYPKMQASAKKTQCMNNLKQLHLAFTSYLQDNDDYLPSDANSAGTEWPLALKRDGNKDPKLYTCPLDDDKKDIETNFRTASSSARVSADESTGESSGSSARVRYSSYGINAELFEKNINNIDNQHTTILLVELGKTSDIPENSVSIEKLKDNNWRKAIDYNRHNDKSLYLFLDGKVSLLPFMGSAGTERVWVDETKNFFNPSNTGDLDS